MSREIKFRAWHKEKKQMIDGSLLFWFKAVAESGKGESVFNTCEWLQYTGLHDKNGKEIYEGDIVKIYTESTPEEAEDEKEIMEIKWNKQGGYLSSVSCGYEFDPLIGNDDIEMEIIGNIYENPELLEPPLGNGAEPIRNISEDDWRKDDR